MRSLLQPVLYVQLLWIFSIPIQSFANIEIIKSGVETALIELGNETKARSLILSNIREGEEGDEQNAEIVEIEPGTKITLSAESNPGFYFSYWEVNGSKLSEKVELEYTMPNNDVEITGIFKKIVEPNVRIVSPGNNVTFESNKEITVNFEASSDNGKITKVELSRNGSIIGTVANPSSNFTLNNLPLGNHILSAKVTDERGATAVSPEVRIEIIKANAPPLIQIISPNNGELFLEGDDIRIEAEAMDSDGNIEKVEFFSNGILISTRTSAPFVASLNNVESGRYEITAKATDNQGAVTTSNLVAVVVESENRPPVVTITSPNNNSKFFRGDQIEIKVNASDPDGNVEKVELFRNGSRIHTMTKTPYTFNWKNAAVGKHNLVARAYDNSGAQTNSTTVTVEVLERIELPNISLISPTNNQIFDQGDPIGLMVMFEGDDKAVEKVEYYRGNQLIGTTTKNPFSFDWKSAPVGRHRIKAIAYGGQPATKKETEIINITVDAKSSQVFSITSPIRNARSYEGMNLTIRVQLPESSRKIKNVEYFRGNQRLGFSSNDPYNFTWRDIPSGEHNLVARLNYEDGTRIISSVVKILVDEGELPELTLDYHILNDEEDSLQFVRLFAEFENFKFDLQEVRFVLDGRVIGKAEKEPFAWDWKNIKPGEYKARAIAIDVYGNRINSEEILVIVEGLEEDEPKDEGPQFTYKVGPNPTTDYVIIYFEDLEEDILFEVVTASLNGTITKQYMSKTEASSLTVDFNNYNKGVYVLFLNFEGKTVISEKIIKN
jgi:chitodextrinase